MGNDLAVSLQGTADSLTITGWYASTDNQIDYFIFSGLQNAYAFVGDDGTTTFSAQTDDHYLFAGLGGNDSLTGAGGHDVLIGGVGGDSLDGGLGSDTASYAGSSAGVSVDLAAGTTSGGDADGDSLANIENLYGSALADTLTGDGSDNILTGADGDDTLTGGGGGDTLIGGSGADVIDGGAGTDRTSYLGSDAAVAIDLAAGTASGGDAAGDTLTSIEDVTGSIQADTLTGDGAANVLDGSWGNDILTGNGGDDTLLGDDGDDTLRGGVGSDVIDGGNGLDTVLYEGNFGSFDVVYDHVAPAFTITDMNPAAFGDEGTDTVSSVGTAVFEGDGVTIDLTSAPVAHGAMAETPVDGTADWNFNVTGGVGALTYSVETTASALDAGSAAVLGFDTADGDVFATDYGNVQVKADGTYEYRPDAAYSGTDSFTYRVTDSQGLASIATVTLGVGAPVGEITSSVTLNGTDEYLSLTQAATGNRQVFTFNTWLQRGALGTAQGIIGADIDGTLVDRVAFTSDDKLEIEFKGLTTDLHLLTTQTFTDAGAWGMLTVSVDTTQFIASDRVKVYWNGVRITGFDTALYLDQNADVQGLNNAREHTVGRAPLGGGLFDGTLAETVFVDGQALDATSFGEFDAGDTWVPVDVSGLIYGTNGFALDYADSANIGADGSGSGNTFSATGLDAGNVSPTVIGTYGNDSLEGGSGDDLIHGADGDDKITGGAGDDILDGGAGTDTVRYAGNQADFDVVYDAGNNLFTITDLNTADGDEGTDTVSQVGAVEFLGDSSTLQLTNLVEANTASAQIQVDGVTEWNLTYEGGLGALAFSVETTNSAIDAATATSLGFDTNIGDVFASDHGNVQVRADGTYEYRPIASYEGLDSFEYRVTDNRGLASVATVAVGVAGGETVGSVPYSMHMDGTDDYLNRTPAASGNRKTWTYSVWFKREPGNTRLLFAGNYGGGTDAFTKIGFGGGDDTVTLTNWRNGSEDMKLQYTYAMADNTHWYHLVAAIDTTQAVATDRVKIWVDGNQITDTSTTLYPPQDIETFVNHTDGSHQVGKYANFGSYINAGFMAQAALIDGQQLTADSFGHISSVTGDWVADDLTGLNYGANGFLLDFSDAAALGNDVSGNGNDFTVNSAPTQSVDTPALGSVSVQVNPTEGNDFIEGSGDADTIDGLGGDDHLIGKGGDDALTGGSGDDQLDGDLGNDTLTGGLGNDRPSLPTSLRHRAPLELL